MDGLPFFVVVKTVHILSASLWIGGILFTIIVNRVLRKRHNPIEATKMLGAIGRAIQRPMRLSLYVTLLTGPLLLILRGIGPTALMSSEFYTTQLGSALLAKFASVAAVLLLLPLHSKFGRVLYELEEEKRYHSTRRKILAVGWISLAFSVLALVLGTVIRST